MIRGVSTAERLQPGTAAAYMHRVARMVRKQVYLSRRLRRAARRLRRSEADVLREALERHLGDLRGAASVTF